MVRVQAYMRKVFGAKTLSVRARPKIKDSAEVYVGEDFVGTLTVDNEDGELCYQFQMAILELDLEDDVTARSVVTRAPRCSGCRTLDQRAAVELLPSLGSSDIQIMRIEVGLPHHVLVAGAVPRPSPRRPCCRG